MAGAMAAITAVFSVIALLLQAWAKAAPARTQENRNEEIQKGRMDIAGTNADPVAERIDGLLTVQAGATTGDTAKLGTDADTARRLAAITGS
jgi:hypothetical protein